MTSTDTFHCQSIHSLFRPPPKFSRYDCPNPTAGWSNWMDSFGGMEVHWDGTTTLPSRVQRQSARRENFAFHHGGVLFIGANLVSKEPYDINANYRKRMNENREWVRQVVQQYRFNKTPRRPTRIPSVPSLHLVITVSRSSGAAYRMISKTSTFRCFTSTATATAGPPSNPSLTGRMYGYLR